MEPAPVIIGNPTDFPYESDENPWYYADDTIDELSITLLGTVDPGTYKFTAEKRNLDDTVVESKDFEITVTSQNLSVSVENKTIGPDGSTSVTIESEGAEQLRVTGDTRDWTITNIEPVPSLIGNPTNSDLPYQSQADDAWYYADEQLDALSIELDGSVAEDTYEFTAQRMNLDDEVVTSETFNITVEKPSYNDWPVDEQQASAVDRDATGDVSLEEVQKGVSDWRTNGQIEEEDYTLSELRNIVDFWINQ